MNPSYPLRPQLFPLQKLSVNRCDFPPEMVCQWVVNCEEEVHYWKHPKRHTSKGALGEKRNSSELLDLVGVSDIFLLFLLGGWGSGSPGRQGGGAGSVFIENPRKGKALPDRAGWEGVGRVSAENWGGGGLNILFRGRNSHQVD